MKVEVTIAIHEPGTEGRSYPSNVYKQVVELSELETINLFTAVSTETLKAANRTYVDKQGKVPHRETISENSN